MARYDYSTAYRSVRGDLPGTWPQPNEEAAIQTKKRAWLPSVDASNGYLLVLAGSTDLTIPVSELAIAYITDLLLRCYCCCCCSC